MSLKTLPRIAQSISIRLRLALLFVGIFGTALVVFGIGTFEILSSSLQKEFDDALFNYAVDITESITLDRSGDLTLLPPHVDRLKIYPFSLGTALIQIRHRSGKVLEQVGNFGEFNLPWKNEFQRLSLGEDPVFRTVNKLEGLPSREAESYRVVSLSIDNSIPPELVLQVAVPMTILENQLLRRKLVFEIGIPVILILSFWAAFILSARALRPISEIVQRSRRISATNLAERVPVPMARDEVRQLALTLNEMMARLEQAFQSQERFVADASHQLLTPLTILKGELEQAQRTGSPPSTESLLQEVDALSQLVKDLLLLARVDAGRESLTLAPLNFEEVVFAAIEKVEKLARPRGIRIQFNLKGLEQLTSHPKVLGEEDLLVHLVFNLLENAVKYSEDNSAVIVTLKQSQIDQELVIADSGPGILESEINRVFERFHRAPTPKRHNAKGYGLGLAIAQQIVRAHGGQIWAENRKNSEGYSMGASFHILLKNF